MKNKVIIIAEAGVNHNGDVNVAKKLIDAASKAKVDYVKFQTFKANSLVSKSAQKAKYQLDKSNETQLEMLKNLELSPENHYELIRHCSSKNVKFFSTAFDIDSLNFLKDLNLDFFKVPSGEITNYSYLKKIASFEKPVILSTGMSNINEISAAIKILTSKKLTLKDITVLHCNTEYPTPFKDVNLKAMISIRDIFNVKIGYSDHTLGFEVPVAAVALGAKVIEKHFTLNNNSDGPDHSASLEPNELTEMVKRIRNIEKACEGSGEKNVSKSEKKNILVVRKSLFTNVKVKKGDLFNENNLIALRPGDGLSPMKIPNLEGKKFNKNLKAYTKISMDDFEE